MLTRPTPKTILFTDAQYIRCGDLDWFSPGGDWLPVVQPQEPQVVARADALTLPVGIRLVAQPASKTEPLALNVRVGRDVGRVLHDGGVLRAWHAHVTYPPGHDKGSYSTAPAASVAIVHSQSEDGFDWKETGRCELPTFGRSACDGFTVFRDPSSTSNERYKAVFSARPTAEERSELWPEYQQRHARHRDARQGPDHMFAMYGATSADGIEWKAREEPLCIHMGDTDTNVYYDEYLGRYVMYTRLIYGDRRIIGRAETEDFYRWPPVEPMLWPNLDCLHDDLYLNSRTEYPGLPGTHLMFPMVYHRHDQTSELRLYSSGDGLCWNEAPGGAVLSPGPVGSWDSEFLWGGKDLVPLGRDRVALPFGGSCYPHKYPRWKAVLDAARGAWACWAPGRLCAVTADGEGRFWTPALKPPGRTLRLNFRTRHAGSIKVAVHGVHGRSFEDCDGLNGDALSQVVTWRGHSDLGHDGDEPIYLAFRLTCAELFSMEFADK